MQSESGRLPESRAYEFLLIAVIAARATSFVFSKMILQDLEPFTILAVRFLLAFCLLALLFPRKLATLTRRDVRSGAVMGVLFFVMMALEMLALREANSSLVSLLENCSIIFVPAIEAVCLRKLPDRAAVCGAALAMLGVVLLAMQQGELRGGFAFGLSAAVAYAAAIVVTERLSRGSPSALGMGIVQVGTMGALSLLAAWSFEQPRLPRTGAQWGIMAILAVVCTGFGFTLQPLAQSRVTAERAGVFCAVSPAIAALLGAAVLRETMGALGIAGLVMILGSIVLPYWKADSRGLGRACGARRDGNGGR